MSFRPQVNDQLTINGATYSIAEHPAAPGVPYGQAGRRAIVYQVAAGEDRRALKVFSRRFRITALVLTAQNLAPYASLPGLQVCRRGVLTPERNIALLQQHPDLAYAMLMPWIAGPTWMEAMVQKQALTPEQSLTLARSLVEILAQMEKKGLAHCDLSGPNVMLPALAQSANTNPQPAIVLVDVEEMYGPEFEQPEALPSGSSGYGHRTAGEGLWGPEADRFAGAVLLAEMLGWCDERVREAAWGEQYFASEEVQQDGERYQLLLKALREQWGASVTGLFEQVWRSDALIDCPPFEEWLAALPERVEEAVVVVETGETEIDEDQVIAPEPDWKVVGGDSKSGEESAALESTAQSIYQALREQIDRGNWKEAERLGQALEVLWPEYRDAKTLLAQARRGDEEEQKVKEEIRQREATVRSEEEHLAEERKGLEEKRLALEEKLRALQEREKELQRRNESLVEAQQNLQRARHLLEAHRWQEARHQLEGLAADEEHIVQAKINAQESPPRRIITAKLASDLQEVRCLRHSPQDIKVNSVAFSPDGVLLASGCTDEMVWLWQVESGELLHTWEGHTARVWHVDFGSNGKILASSSDDGTVRLWKVSDGTSLRVLETSRSQATSVAFSPDGKLLASASAPGIVQLWRVTDGTLLHIVESQGLAVWDVAFSPDGSLGASAGRDGAIQLWRASDGEVLHNLVGHTGTIYSVVFSPDGTTLASGSSDNTVRFWQVSGGKELRTLSGLRGWARCVAFSPDGAILAVATGSIVQLWAVPGGALLRTLAEQEHRLPVRSVAFSPDGTLLASGSEDGTVRLWGVE